MTMLCLWLVFHCQSIVSVEILSWDVSPPPGHPVDRRDIRLFAMGDDMILEPRDCNVGATWSPHHPKGVAAFLLLLSSVKIIKSNILIRKS